MHLVTQNIILNRIEWTSQVMQQDRAEGRLFFYLFYDIFVCLFVHAHIFVKVSLHKSTKSINSTGKLWIWQHWIFFYTQLKTNKF